MVRDLLVLGSISNTEFARIRADSAGAWRLPNILRAIEGPRADEWPNLLTYGKWMVCETCDSEPSWDPSWRCPSRLAFEQHFSPGIYFFVGMAAMVRSQKGKSPAAKSGVAIPRVWAW